MLVYFKVIFLLLAIYKTEFVFENCDKRTIGNSPFYMSRLLFSY